MSDSESTYTIEELGDGTGQVTTAGNLSEILIIVAVLIAIVAGVVGFMYYNKQKKAEHTAGSKEESE